MTKFLEFDSIDHCPACGDGAIATIQPQISQCRRCAVLFRNPRPTQAEIARSYDTGNTFDAWQEQEPARAAMWQRRAAIIEKFRSHGRLLDIGTGDGRFLQTCREIGYDAQGTEVSQAGAAYARRNGFDVHLGQITEIELPRASFDIVSIWHVLEHVPNPRAVLRAAHMLLRPGGILAVAVPNEENFFVRRTLGIQGAASPFDLLQFGSEIHLTYFRPATFRAALSAADFEILEFGVDDLYSNRGLKMRLKLSMQQLLVRTAKWHFAVAMYALCQRAN